MLHYDDSASNWDRNNDCVNGTIFTNSFETSDGGTIMEYCDTIPGSEAAFYESVCCTWELNVQKW